MSHNVRERERDWLYVPFQLVIQAFIHHVTTSGEGKHSLIRLMEKILHHLGCPKTSWYWDKTNISGILSGAGFFPSTVRKNDTLKLFTPSFFSSTSPSPLTQDKHQKNQNMPSSLTLDPPTPPPWAMLRVVHQKKHDARNGSKLRDRSLPKDRDSETEERLNSETLQKWRRVKLKTKN